MKKLLIISFLTFFSISAIAEDKYRCKFFQGCEDQKCTTKVTVGYSSLIVNEGWFSNELFYNNKDVSKNTLFGENTLHWGIYSKKNFDDEVVAGKFYKYAMQYKFDKTTSVLRGYISYREPQESKIRPRVDKPYMYREWQYLCDKVN